jgi:hypothetical protein
MADDIGTDEHKMESWRLVRSKLSAHRFTANTTDEKMSSLITELATRSHQRTLAKEQMEIKSISADSVEPQQIVICEMNSDNMFRFFEIMSKQRADDRKLGKIDRLLRLRDSCLDTVAAV